MKFTFEDLNKKNDWLVAEIMSSLTGECYTPQVMEEQFFDIKLSVNGNLIEPKLFNKILGKIEEQVDREARALVNQELSIARSKIDKINTLLDLAANNISDEFNLDISEYYEE